MRPSTLLLCLLTACRFDPDPPALPPRAQTSPAASAAAPVVALSPPEIAGRAASVVHLQVTLPDQRLVAPSSVALVRGELSDVALRGLREGTLPASARERAVPLLTRSDPGDLRIFPSAPLTPGSEYTLAVGTLALRHPLIIAENDDPPLERVWPPPGEISPLDQAIFCGQAPLPDSMEPLGMDATPLVVTRGAAGSAALACVTVAASGASEAWPFPAALTDGERVLARLSPAPLLRGSRPPAPPLDCADDELPFGPGCLRVLDDRGLWRLPEEPWLQLRGDEPPRQHPGAAVLRGLEPASSALLEATLLDLRGGLHHASASVETLPPLVHVVINEVLADAAGPEPASEWIELYNDGSTEITLDGWSLDDAQGSTPLPAFSLAPGAFALLANEDLDTSADRAPAPGCAVRRVPALGKGGLSNQGEALALRDAAGQVISRFPATPKPRAGRSVLRRRPDALDDAPGSFALSEGSPTPCAPNAP